MSAPSVWDTDARLSTSRGRHRGLSVVAKAKGRTAVAAATTGAIAVSGIALAGCSPAADHTNDAFTGDGTATTGLNLASALGAGGSSGSTMVHPVSLASTLASADSGTASDLAAPALASKADVDLHITNPNVNVYADQAVEVGFQLTNKDTNQPLANQLVKVQVKLPTGFATFLHLTTNGSGYTSYTARVLTTTQITAVFDGTDALQSAVADNVGTLNVMAKPAVSASRGITINAPTNGDLGSKAVYLASLQAGKPYVYGANGPDSFDCSSLVQYVYKQLGRNLPRTAEAQYEATLHVDSAHKQVGDLIFFGSPGSIYHVGIYAGDGQMWAAPHSGDVVKLESIYSTTYYVGRVL
ncbi:C40 family peptidase [Frankia sp. AgB1.9]|uniref:C40 family peptidase n=1 Tax=unclassified Frankia TaxID=2632575 RepID=UPI0019337FAD|nr:MULTISPECIES: C40 family peptidase [unclassified Frankia]MBL7491568.1 C40 family peptidase [Frankia sp. AgW1.1]MBL7553498.1 C40 family peptidase [Frankia sp. AgB1.9]MBL7617931.1 C40 family peptidase [Frankia sp. AgB1.8]